MIEQPSQRIVIYPSRPRLLGTAALFVALLGLLTLARESGGPLVQFVYWSGLPLFGFGALWCLYRLAVRRPALEMDERGVLDRSSLAAAGFVRWSEIEAVCAYQVHGQRFLGIFLRDADAFMSGQPWFKRWFWPLYRRMGVAPINIPERMLPTDAASLSSTLGAVYAVEVRDPE